MIKYITLLSTKKVSFQYDSINFSVFLNYNNLLGKYVIHYVFLRFCAVCEFGQQMNLTMRGLCNRGKLTFFCTTCVLLFYFCV